MDMEVSIARNCLVHGYDPKKEWDHGMVQILQGIPSLRALVEPTVPKVRFKDQTSIGKAFDDFILFWFGSDI